MKINFKERGRNMMNEYVIVLKGKTALNIGGLMKQLGDSFKVVKIKENGEEINLSKFQSPPEQSE